MLEDLQRRHYSEATTRYYIRAVERFAQHFHCSPDRLGPRHIREYQAQLFTVQKLSPGSVTNHLCALRFFYIQTLKRPWSITDTPYPKKTHRLPTILSQEEVAQVIDAACTPFHRTILITLYATGVRDAELTRLKVSDIDSRRMVIHIQGGKGRQDRDVMLSPVLLDELRAHWRRLRKKSSTWLFPGNRWHTGARPIDTKTPRHACQYAARRAGIKKRVYPHLLRHYVPCLTMSCNGEPLRILPGEIRSPPAKPADMTRHSFLLAADSSGKRGVSPQVYSDPVVHAARMFSPKLSPSWQSSLPDEFVGFQLVRDQPQGA
jgi:site-specific recombinase XerD